MILWDEIVKKREEEIAKGWFSKECSVSNVFLETTRENFLKFKKMERNHILSGIINEQNIWEDSDVRCYTMRKCHGQLLSGKKGIVKKKNKSIER